MFFDLNIKNFFDGLFDTLDAGIAKLDHLPGIGKYDMIMLTVKIRFLVLCLVLPELVFSNQPALQ